MSIYDKSSLVLIPSGTKTGKVYSQKPTNGDGDFTFTRSSAATRVNADGNIEKETQNKLLYSNTFSNAAWTNVNSSETAGQSGYDGTNTAWKLIASGGNNDKIFQSVTQTGVVTFSIYVKKGNANFIAIEFGGFSYYNLQTGALGSSGSIISNKIEDVGGGWYRCSITVSISSTTNAQVYVANADNSTNTSNGDFVYIQDAQVEQGLVARDYIETTAAAVYGGIADNVPRLDYTDSSCPALLLEPQRTNVLSHSEYFGGWGQINTINTANALISPEGVQNANKLIAASGVNNNVINQQVSAGTYTASIFAKKGEFEGLVIATGTTGAFFNLNTYAYRTHYQSAATSHKIEDYGNGWHRYSITFTISGNDSLYIGPNDNVSNTLGVTGNNSNGIYIYGATLEAATYATSYIPTYGSSVTRVKELNSITGVSDLIGQTEGVVYMDFVAQTSAGQSQSHFALGAGGNEILLYGGNQFIFYSSGGVQMNGGNIVNGQRYKVAFGYKANDYVAYVNGTQIGTDTSATVPTMSAIYLNAYSNGTEVQKKNINQTLLFKTRLSNEELAALTTI